MSQARDYRRDENGRGVDPFQKRKRRYKSVLRLLAAEGLFAATPRGFQEAIWRGKWPEPRVVLEDGVEPWAAGVLERAFTATDVAYGGGRVTFADLVAVIMPLRAVLGHVGAGAGILPSVRRLIDRALPELERIVGEQAPGLFERVSTVAAKVAVVCGGADWGVVCWRLDVPRAAEARKVGAAFVLSRSVSEVVQVRVDGSNRPAYRVGCPEATGHEMGGTGARWVSVPASLFGEASPGELPVYVQAHALRQMHERLDLPMLRPWAEYHMSQSLLEPRVARGCGGGDMLVEFRLNDRKAGYLVVSRVGDRALVRTFLLLTMAGTPEGDRLGRRLRLTRDEARWLGLYRLSSVAASDVRDDAELVGILGECGCGQLAEVARGVDFVPVTTGYAAELRKYIGLASAAAAEVPAGDVNPGDCENGAEGRAVRAAA